MNKYQSRKQKINLTPCLSRLGKGYSKTVEQYVPHESNTVSK